MSSTVVENMNRLADYNVHIIVDDSQEIRGLIWEIVKNLLERLVMETPFELTFVNNPESGRVENRASLARMMMPITPHGTRKILEKLDNIVLAELRELWDLPTEDVPDREKLKVIVILYPAPLRGLENSVEFAVKSLVDAALPDDRIGIQFVQVGFSRRLFEALKDVVENDYTNLADFTTYMGSMVDQRLGRIRLGSTLPTFNISAYPTVRDCPTGVWTFICATHDSTGVRLGFNGHLGNKAPLTRLKFEKINIGMYASKSISLANIKVYDRVLAESEIHSNYFTSLPDNSGLSHQPGSSSAI
ncbi:hypothetical protein B0H10DRAFT_2233544 [Mycena sp. CBHHK59/15]|nr:hypothetical protein B0H10DRAFT_2235907 [Mycena sp. CBHHK59/15]KAJ6590798.1 hypothetical protein B0H10DRAFT_2233544 [Mycena sp. CBHHK59/15]